ncbi:YkvA family protein [Bauldia sp.]|uniref:YkvA family protein n=1 Tax=Bauldia sp. TaxID=2575872 RepID=UPI003BAA8B6A
MNEVLYGEILGPEEEDPKREQRVRRRFWATFRKAARVIPYTDEVVAAYYCALDPTTPNRVRGILLAALAYFVLPVDALPDFLAGVGFTDDLTVLVAAISMVRSHITPAHREAARAVLEDEDIPTGKPFR